jgi:hypothetical protein
LLRLIVKFVVSWPNLILFFVNLFLFFLYGKYFLNYFFFFLFNIFVTHFLKRIFVWRCCVSLYEMNCIFGCSGSSLKFNVFYDLVCWFYLLNETILISYHKRFRLLNSKLMSLKCFSFKIGFLKRWEKLRTHSSAISEKSLFLRAFYLRALKAHHQK